MTEGSPARGEIWVAQLDSPIHVVGHEQADRRPVLIVSADFVNRSAADMVIVVPLTTADRRVRSHVPVVPPDGGVSEPSAVQCEQIRAISSRRLRKRLGGVNDATLSRVERALRLLLELS